MFSIISRTDLQDLQVSNSGAIVNHKEYVKILGFTTPDHFFELMVPFTEFLQNPDKIIGMYPIIYSKDTKISTLTNMPVLYVLDLETINA